MKLYGFWRSLATFRVRIALNLKGIPFDETMVDLLAGQQFADGYRGVNPQAVVPALIENDGAPLFQSLAIVEYLDETHPEPPLLPGAPRERARVRGLAMIAACDVHPLIVPRVRNYLGNEFKLDEPAKLKWIRHWFNEGSRAIESHLAGEKETGRYCHGDRITLADVCVVSHAVGAKIFECDPAPFPTLQRIVADCLKLDAFARAHPLKQPGASLKH
ncbi:MAG TPA: maleylacetoacetate isomerase [Burkholderiales bacterium]|nr:maleylacetoacetate isomerase [Burkholderiales bacterium]